MIVEDLFENSATDFFKQLQKTNPKFKNLRIHGDPEHDELRRQDLVAQQARQGEQQQQAQQAAAQRIEQDRANMPELVAQLKTLMSKFDPNFEYSDDHSFWTQQRALQNQIGELKSRIKAAGMNITESRINEIDWKGIQKKAGEFSKGAQKFTKNVSQTGQALGGAATALGGAAKEVGKQFIAKPVAATYGAAKSGLNKAADVAKGVYGDVKAGAQKVGRGVDTVATDVGNAGTWAGDKINQAGRGVANVVGGTANAIGATAGGATTGVGRAAAKGFNTGVKNVGGGAVNRLQTNVFKQQPTAATGDAQAAVEPAQDTAQVDQRMPSSALNPATGLAWTQPEIAQWRAASAPDTTAAATPTPVAPSADTTTADTTPTTAATTTPTTTAATTTPTTGRKTVSMNVAKQAIDTAAQALTKVRSRDRAKVAQYAQSKLLQVGQPSPAASKPTWKGRKTRSPGLSKKQKDYIAKIGVDESLSWSKDFDPGKLIWNKITRSH
jgi:hypothetical protein